MQHRNWMPWLFLTGFLCLGVVTLCWFIGARSNEHFRRPVYFETIDIDTQTLAVRLKAPFAGTERPSSEYCSSFRSQASIGVYRYDGSKNLPYRVRYSALSTDHDWRLRGRSKTQELLQGPYGVVCAHTNFFYVNGIGSRLDVLLYDGEIEREPGQVVEGLPTPLPELRAITIVRIFGHADTVVRAKYDGDGNLQEAIASSKMKHGGTQSELNPGKKYGLPVRFPVTEYLKTSEWDWNDPGMPNSCNLINFHYDYNRWVRSDHFDPEGKRTTRFLTYAVTPEDRILEAIDRQVPFNERRVER